MIFLFSASKVTHHRKLPAYRSSCYAGGPTPVFSLIQVLNISYLCDFSAQAIRKMGAFNKKRRHPRAVNNLEEELPEKVSLQLVHLHDQVSIRLLFPLSLSFSQKFVYLPLKESEEGVWEIAQFCPQLTSLYFESPSSQVLASLPNWTTVRF